MNYSLNDGYRVSRVLKGRSNVYLIERGDALILVDTGKSNVGKALINLVADQADEAGKLKYLILTHTHFDHCGNAA